MALARPMQHVYYKQHRYLHHGRYVVSQGAFIVWDALANYDTDLATKVFDTTPACTPAMHNGEDFRKERNKMGSTFSFDNS